MSAFNAFFSNDSKPWTAFEEDESESNKPRRRRSNRRSLNKTIADAKEQEYLTNRIDEIMWQRRRSNPNIAFDESNTEEKSTTASRREEPRGRGRESNRGSMNVSKRSGSISSRRALSISRSRNSVSPGPGARISRSARISFSSRRARDKSPSPLQRTSTGSVSKGPPNRSPPRRTKSAMSSLQRETKSFDCPASLNGASADEKVERRTTPRRSASAISIDSSCKRRSGDNNRVKRTSSRSSQSDSMDQAKRISTGRASSSRTSSGGKQKSKLKKTPSKSKEASRTKKSLNQVLERKTKPIKSSSKRSITSSSASSKVSTASSKMSAESDSSALQRMKDLSNRHQSLQNEAMTIKKSVGSCSALAKLARQNSRSYYDPFQQDIDEETSIEASARQSKSNDRWLVSKGDSHQGSLKESKRGDQTDAEEKGTLNSRLHDLQAKWKEATLGATMIVDVNPQSIARSSSKNTLTPSAC